MLKYNDPQQDEADENASPLTNTSCLYFLSWNESFAIEWYVSIFEFCINLSVNCFLIHWTHSTLDSSSEEDFQNEKNELK